jgi:hypothetical protein
LRCECGQFVRLDRALAERRSEPTPPPVEIARIGVREEEEDATRMMSSLAASALSPGYNRPRQASLLDDELAAAQREGALRSRPSAPAPARKRQPSIAPTDKPLWYVDLGGTELVQMTIEQLILARRGGKLGEGALVWREGMPSWRPVGTLIPAASASSHPAPVVSPSSAPGPSRPATTTPLVGSSRPPGPIRTPPARRPPPTNPPPEDATPRSLASYDRPMATLEFAFERSERTPLVPATRSRMPSMDSGAAHLSRPPTPLPRASLSSVLSTPFPRPGHLPSFASLGAAPTPSSAARPSAPPPVPVRVASPLPLPAAAPLVEALPAHTSDRAPQHGLLNLQIADTLSERPRWVSACIALVVCITASAAGASLVRSLRQHPKPQAQALPVSAAPPAVVSVAAQKPATEPPRSAPSSAPLVVDVESLSVEHKRTLPRAARVAPKPAPTLSTEASDETTPPANDPAPASASEAEPDAPAAATSSEAPPAARSNPYGTGSLIDQIKKATADEEAGQ